MSLDKCIGIGGATGVVCKELITLLVNNNYTNLKLCASERSIGMILNVKSKQTSELLSFVVEELCETFFNDKMSVVFFCSDNDISKQWIPFVINKGITAIDNSSAFRLDKSVPLVIPEINPHLLTTETKLIANPNCSTVILCMVLFPLQKLSNIVRVDVSTYQAVSGAGQAGIDELNNQIEEYTKFPNTKLTTHAFNSQILLNCFSHNSAIDLESGYNGEELKIIEETVKILDTQIEVSATCVRIPVMRAHCESIKIVFSNPVNEYSLPLIYFANCLAAVDPTPSNPNDKIICARETFLSLSISASKLSSVLPSLNLPEAIKVCLLNNSLSKT